MESKKETRMIRIASNVFVAIKNLVKKMNEKRILLFGPQEWEEFVSRINGRKKNALAWQRVKKKIREIELFNSEYLEKYRKI
jgi:hypothetical protein